MSTNVKRATRKGLLPDYYSILAIIFNIIHVFFSKIFFVLFCFPSNMAAKYAVRHVSRHAKVVYSLQISSRIKSDFHSLTRIKPVRSTTCTNINAEPTESLYCKLS